MPQPVAADLSPVIRSCCDQDMLGELLACADVVCAHPKLNYVTYYMYSFTLSLTSSAAQSSFSAQRHARVAGGVGHRLRPPAGEAARVSLVVGVRHPPPQACH